LEYGSGKVNAKLNALAPSAELAAKFLSLYECLTDPRHTELLIQTIGDWLGEEDQPLHIESLEQHSASVAKLAVGLLGKDSGQSQSTQRPACVLGVPQGGASAEIIEQALGVSIVAPDIATFRNWVTGPEHEKIFRVVDDDGQGHLCLARKTLDPDNEAVLQFWLNDPEIAEIAETLLVRDLDISHSEILVLREIAIGSRRSDIATRLGKSDETIRSQIKSIANKMGVSGQIEIAAELRNLEIHSIARVSPTAKSAPDTRQLVLADGRTLDYREYGPPGGQPILYFHCFLHGKHLPTTIEKPLAQSNCRIVSVSRAGFGGSSAHVPDGKDILAASSRDYLALIRHLGLGRCTLLAHATGFASAFHFAANYPELTRKVLGLDAVPPITRAVELRQLKGLFKASARTMTLAPATFSLMTGFAMRRLKTFDDSAKTFRRHILYPSVELENLETPAGIEAGTRNVRDMRVNGLTQCIAEARAYRSDWTAIGPDSNRWPEVILFHTRSNPFVSASGTRNFADALNCECVELGETFPFLEPHLGTMLKRLAGHG